MTRDDVINLCTFLINDTLENCVQYKQLGSEAEKMAYIMGALVLELEKQGSINLSDKDTKKQLH